MIADGSKNSNLGWLAESIVRLSQSMPVTFVDTVTLSTGVIYEGESFNQEKVSLFRGIYFDGDLLAHLHFGHPLAATTLLKDLQTMIKADTALIAFAEKFTRWDDIANAVAYLSGVPSALKWLTLLKDQFPLVYTQALFCGWLGTTLIHDLKRSARDAYNLFFLAMMHDIGLLFLPINVIRDQTVTFTHSFKILHNHAAMSFYALKACASELPDDILISVMEHHEKLDGTGYPLGKTSKRISRYGHWLGFLDSINGIYTKRLKGSGRSMRDLITMVQMNGHGRFGVLGKKFIERLRTLPESNVRVVPNVLMPHLIQAVRDHNSYLSSCVSVIATIAQEIGFHHDDSRMHALQNSIIHINISITQSGIINPAYMRWLDQVEAEGLIHAYREVEDVYLMMHEVIYHIEKLRQKIEIFLDSLVDAADAFYLRKGLERLERVVIPKVHPNLDPFWISGVQ